MKKDNHIITVIGINHHSARIEDRELLEIDRKEIKQALLEIHKNPAVKSVLILKTCNRLEFYLLIVGDTEAFDVICSFYKQTRAIDIEDQRNVFCMYNSADAIRHLFRVISGLDSLVVGEYQIQGQVRDAYSLACDVKTLENVMHKLFHAAFRCGKAVRSKTSLGKGRQSVSGVAAGLFFEYCDKKDNIVIIGVNENTRIIARELKAASYNNLIFINRTLYKAEIMAEEFDSEAYPFDKLMYILSNADAVFSSTGAPHYIVNSKMLQSLAKRQIGPKLIIDMAVPRDFNTEGLPSDIRTFDISDLKKYLSKQSEKKAKDLPKAEKIIEDEVKVFSAWTEFSGSDLLKPYAEKFEITRLQILDEFRSQFSSKDLELVDKLSRRMLHRLQATFANVLKKKNQDDM
jgi:glutamyl-tRNA reductase